MFLLCLAGKHAPLPTNVWNDGLYFSNCRRCGRDMVRSERAWEIVDRRHRVVWRPAQRLGGGSAARPRLKPLMVIPSCSSESMVSADPNPIYLSRIDRPRPGFSFVQLFSMGIDFLAYYGPDSLGKWQRLLAAPGAGRAPTRLLARRS